jgi:hypothetical protein
MGDMKDPDLLAALLLSAAAACHLPQQILDRVIASSGVQLFELLSRRKIV